MKRKKTNPKKPIVRYKKNLKLAALACIGAAAIIFGALRLSPRAYRPLTPDNPDEVSPYLTHKLGPDFFNQIQLLEPFELLVEQHGLNDIISRDDWPQDFGEITASTPTFLFEKDTIYLMTQITYHGLSAMLTITAQPIQDKQGRINMNIQSVRLGLVPFTAIAARIAQHALADAEEELAEEPEVKAILHAIATNTPFDPVFNIDGRRIWINSFSLQPAALRLQMVPENKAVYY